jgi:probable rRNA maturation factor
MTVELNLQRVASAEGTPGDREFEAWVNAALAQGSSDIVTIRIVDRDESADLNLRYRDRQGATNVLSFNADVPAEIDLPLLGDIVICGPLVVEEAAKAGKTVQAHWAHLVVHGVLHLQGYDHELESQAHEMESREIELLAELGFANPYS